MTLLRELYYFDRKTGEDEESKRYDPKYDSSVLKYSDTRKTKLTLRAINKIRKASEADDEEKEKELFYIRQMYGVSSNAEPA